MASLYLGIGPLEQELVRFGGVLEAAAGHPETSRRVAPWGWGRATLFGHRCRPAIFPVAPDSGVVGRCDPGPSGLAGPCPPQPVQGPQAVALPGRDSELRPAGQIWPPPACVLWAKADFHIFSVGQKVKRGVVTVPHEKHMKFKFLRPYIKLYWHLAALPRRARHDRSALHRHSGLGSVRGCLLAVVAELSNRDRDHLACKAPNVYSPVLHREAF